MINDNWMKYSSRYFKRIKSNARIMSIAIVDMFINTTTEVGTCKHNL